MHVAMVFRLKNIGGIEAKKNSSKLLNILYYFGIIDLLIWV